MISVVKLVELRFDSFFLFVYDATGSQQLVLFFNIISIQQNAVPL